MPRHGVEEEGGLGDLYELFSDKNFGYSFILLGAHGCGRSRGPWLQLSGCFFSRSCCRVIGPKRSRVLRLRLNSGPYTDGRVQL
jgi:hypothetical protein